MIKDNLIIYVSSRNNYDMLSGEVLKNINTEGFEFINVDDNSSEEEIIKGKQICDDNNIVFLENKSSGVQMATQTLIDFINENRPNCKWVICFQHDNYPVSQNFFKRLSKLISDDKLDRFGSIGFNLLDSGDYTEDSYSKYMSGEKPCGLLCFRHLSNLNTSNRWITPRKNKNLSEIYFNHKKPFIVDMQIWAIVGINVEVWNNVIEPNDEYKFLLWFPDIVMQLNYNNYPTLVLPDLYCMNNQRLKLKYGLPKSITSISRDTDNIYSDRGYGNHFNTFTSCWGWNYEDVNSSLPPLLHHYKDTLISKHYEHNINNDEPYEIVDLGEY